jgi:hypothetical protein
MSANDEIFDRAVIHAVDLAKYTNGVVRRIIATLNRSDARLSAELTAAIERAGEDAFSVQRLESLLASVRSINVTAYGQIALELSSELQAFAAYEANFQTLTLQEALPAVVGVASVSAEVVAAAALARPFQGVLLRDVLADVEAQTAKRIRRAIAQGIVESRTTQQIVRDVIGTRARSYADGLLNRSRRDVEAIVRTAVSHTAGVVQDNVMEANADLIKALAWSSTIDLRTSEGCRIRDGKLYHPATHKPIGHSIPWGAGPGRLHWQCRSASVPVLKSWKAMGIDLEGDPNLAGTRASLDGQVPQEMTYAEWIKRQPFSRQVEVLGESRAKLLRDGGLSMEDLYSQRGQYLTLAELKEKSAAAFKRAGLSSAA